MHNLTLSLALLLGGGFAASRLAQFLKLPSVTGYICAGLLLGPSALGLVSAAAPENLEHFTQLALMMIAFGIGEHLELNKLRRSARTVALAGVGESLGAFALTMAACLLTALAVGVGGGAWQTADYVALALLLGAVSVATAPATTMHVMRELRSAGPLTSTLMAVVAVDNGLAIMFFGIGMSAARQVVGAEGGLGLAVLHSAGEISASLLMGLATGVVMDWVAHRLSRRSEMLTAGLALLLLCGEGARILGFSPLLAGMAAGFTVVNRDRRDVRLFRAINAFEPPIYVLFFTLAGAHLDLKALYGAGALALVYFLARILGKMFGAGLGARMAGAARYVRRLLGVSLVPQAGVAIGLLFLIRADDTLGDYSRIITPVVLGAVVLSELVGPALTRFALTMAKEAETAPEEHPAAQDRPHELVSWTWGQLTPTVRPDGLVLFCPHDLATAAALGRMATLIAHNFGAHVMAVRGSRPGETPDPATPLLLEAARREVAGLGYELETEVIDAPNQAAALLKAAQERRVWAILLGSPLTGGGRDFQRMVEGLSREAPCQVMVMRFGGQLHTERILVPVSGRQDLSVVSGVVRALSWVGNHRITLLSLMPADAVEEELEEAEAALEDWAHAERLAPVVRGEALAAQARLDTILQEAHRHDLLIMPAAHPFGLQRLLFGSLSGDVASVSPRPMLLVYPRPERQEP